MVSTMNKTGRELVLALLELRRSLQILGGMLLGLTLMLFFVSGHLLEVVQAHLHAQLYFFSIAGPFLSHVKLSFCGALYLLMPFVLNLIWRILTRPFQVSAFQRFWFVFATCLLFYGGTIFCYMLTLPYGIQFLLEFQNENLKAVISISRFTNFILIFLLAFGLVFELPVFMIFTAKVGLLSNKTFKKNRRYAILAIAILAAVLTPTPDVVNMVLMGLPLYVLYEAGIVLIKLFQLDKKNQVGKDKEWEGQ